MMCELPEHLLVPGSCASSHAQMEKTWVLRMGLLVIAGIGPALTFLPREVGAPASYRPIPEVQVDDIILESKYHTGQGRLEASVCFLFGTGNAPAVPV